VLALEDKVARAITNEVKIRLSLQEQTRLAAPARQSRGVRRLPQGRYQWMIGPRRVLKKSIEYFAHAVKQDPDYAPAWAGLADAYS